MGQGDPDGILNVSLLQEDRYANLLYTDTASNLGNPFLAYLSARIAGSHDTPRLLGEGINIISEVQFSGFRHVIETTWQVSGKHCVEVSGLFYKSFARMDLVDSAVSLALHEALVTGRDAWTRAESQQEVTFTREAPGEVTLERKKKGPTRKLVRAWWAPCVHFGP